MLKADASGSITYKAYELPKEFQDDASFLMIKEPLAEKDLNGRMNLREDLAQSGATAPTWSNTPGDEFQDGNHTWKVFKNREIGLGDWEASTFYSVGDMRKISLGQSGVGAPSWGPSPTVG